MRVDLKVTTWCVREADDDDWDNGDFDGSVETPRIVNNNDRYGFSYRGVDTDLEPPFYVVYCGYYTGNTFGRDYDGTILKIVKEEWQADELVSKLRGAGKHDYSITYDGESISIPWNGYFESLDGIYVERLS